MTSRQKHRQAVANFKRIYGPSPVPKNMGRKKRRINYWFAIACKNFCFNIYVSRITAGCGSLE